jgi:RNA polymerase sigma factor (sigma-70 family)
MLHSFDAELVRSQPILHSAARKLCSRRSNIEETALDVLQDTNLRALACREQFVGGSLVGWVYAILRNAFRDHLRKLKTRDCEALFTDLATRDENGEYTDPEYPDVDDPHSKLEAAQTFDQINALPILTATAMFCAGLGMTCSEIAERLGTSEANARQLLTRGRHTLRERNS